MICKVRDVPVYYEEYGTGKPLLCIHGWSVDHRLMSGCLEPIFDEIKGYRRIYPDLPGMGKTPAAAWIKNADDMLEFLGEFIKAVIPDETFPVIAESYGGYLTLGLIRDMQARIDGVAMICPVITAKSSNRRLPEKRIIWKADGFDTTHNDSNVNYFLDMAVIATPEIYQKYKRDILPGVSLANQDFLSRYENNGYAFSFEDSMSTITFDKPTSILTGRQDHVVGYLEAFDIIAKFPRATFAVLDCAGHNLQIENEPVFRQMIKDWIWRVELSKTTE